MSEEKVTSVTGDENFVNGLITSFSVILVSELGDKTFFIAAIMAMKHSRLAVFLGAMTANGSMIILSALLGRVTQVVPKIITYYISIVLFALFGFKMLFEGYKMDSTEAKEEYEEAEDEIRRRQLKMTKEKEIASTTRSTLFHFFGEIYLEALMLTFVTEWGDRSQVSTIIVAARENVYAVILGGLVGHSICTGVAVIGGRLVSEKISLRTVTITGGILFLFFALSALHNGEAN